MRTLENTLRAEIQTFEQRIKDQTKIALSDEFIERVYATAKGSNLSATEVWLKWREHCRINESMDQSPTYSEFLQWNNLKEVK